MKASDFGVLIPDACSEVLDSMYFTTTLGSGPRDAMPECLPDGQPPLIFGLGFTGDVSGRFGVHLEQTTARTLSANFLGQEEADISAGELAEVVGELANMLCGSIVSRIEEKSKFVLSHPEPSLIPFFSSENDVLIYAMDTDSGFITIWILVEGEKCPA